MDEDTGAGQPTGDDPPEPGASTQDPTPATVVPRELTSERALVEHARTLGRDPTLVAVDDGELESLVRDGAAEVAALTCRWLVHLAELVVRGVWAVQGARTPGAWLSWAVGMAPSTAREHVRVALRLRDCPLLLERFAAGTLSYSKVRALTRVATPATEPMLLQWADAAPAATIERIVRDARRVERAGRTAGRRDDLGLHGRWRDDGSYELVVRVGAADGLALEQHLERLVELEERDRYGTGGVAVPDAPEDDPGDDGEVEHDDDRRGRFDDATEDAPTDGAAGDAAGRVGSTGARVPRAVLAADALVEALAVAAACPDGANTTLSASRHDVVVHASTTAWALVTRADASGADTPSDGPSDHPSGDWSDVPGGGDAGPSSPTSGGDGPDLTLVPPPGDEDEHESASAEALDQSDDQPDDGPPPRRAAAVRDGRGRPRMLRTAQLALAGCTARTWLLVDGDEQHGGNPADLGRTRRDPDARLRRLLAARDVTCRFPGCGARRGLHAHHVRWWSRGGSTDLDNLVLLCRAHHRAVHDDGWELRPAGTGRWTFHRPTPAGPDPASHPWARPLPGASAEALAEVVRLHARDLAPGALRPPHHDGSGYDHGLAVELLVARLAEVA